MKFSEFLMMCPGVSVNTMEGNTYAIVYEDVFGGAALRINCNSFSKYIFAVKRLDPDTLAYDALGKRQGKEYRLFYHTYKKIIERMKSFVEEYIEELKEIAEDILPSKKN